MGIFVKVVKSNPSHPIHVYFEKGFDGKTSATVALTRKHALQLLNELELAIARKD